MAKNNLTRLLGDESMLKKFKCVHPTIRDKNGGPMIMQGELRIAIGSMAIEEAKKVTEIMDNITEKTIEARMTLEEACNGIGEYVEKLKPLKLEVTDQLRAMRTTTAIEVASILKPLEDLRKFFLGEQHDKEIERLREFVDLCERLEKLKKSGFLDTVADTMLKLS
jgi:hypothetical protein